MAFYHCGSGAMSKIYYLTDIDMPPKNRDDTNNPTKWNFNAQTFGIRSWGKLTVDNFILGLNAIYYTYYDYGGSSSVPTATIQVNKSYDQSTGILALSIPALPHGANKRHFGFKGSLYLITRPIPNYKDD